MIRWAAALLCALSSACGDNLVSGSPDAGQDASPDAAPGAGDCPVSTDAQLLIEELVHKSLMDAVHSAVNTHTMERGFASQLVGVHVTNIGHLTLVEECSGPSSFDPYCEYAVGGGPPEEPFYEDHDKCSRLGCEAANVGTATMYWTMRPETDPDVRHAFTYATTAPPGEAVADPNPLLVWRYDLTTADAVTVSSDLDRALVVTPTGGDAIDLDHTGTISVNQVEFEPTGASLTLEFPDLAPAGPATLEVTLDAEAAGTGALRLGADTIATIGGTFSFETPLEFAWCPDA